MTNESKQVMGRRGRADAVSKGNTETLVTKLDSPVRAATPPITDVAVSNTAIYDTSPTSEHVQSLQASLDEAVSEVHMAHRQVENNQRDVARLQALVAEQGNQIGALQSELAQLRDRQREEVDHILDAIADLGTIADRVQPFLDKVPKRLAKLERSVQEYQRSTDTQKNQMYELKHTLDEFREARSVREAVGAGFRMVWQSILAAVLSILQLLLFLILTPYKRLHRLFGGTGGTMGGAGQYPWRAPGPAADPEKKAEKTKVPAQEKKVAPSQRKRADGDEAFDSHFPPLEACLSNVTGGKGSQ